LHPKVVLAISIAKSSSHPFEHFGWIDSTLEGPHTFIFSRRESVSAIVAAFPDLESQVE